MEEQVISRAHRMGATRPIHVETLAMHGTIEEQMVEFLQVCLSLTVLWWVLKSLFSCSFISHVYKKWFASCFFRMLMAVEDSWRQNMGNLIVKGHALGEHCMILLRAIISLSLVLSALTWRSKGLRIIFSPYFLYSDGLKYSRDILPLSFFLYSIISWIKLVWESCYSS